METSLLELIKLAFLIGTPIGTLSLHMFKKLEVKQEKIEGKLEVQGDRMSELEKALLEMRTEFKFTSRDIKDIREMLEKLTGK